MRVLSIIFPAFPGTVCGVGTSVPNRGVPVVLPEPGVESPAHLLLLALLLNRGGGGSGSGSGGRDGGGVRSGRRRRRSGGPLLSRLLELPLVTDKT